MANKKNTDQRGGSIKIYALFFFCFILAITAGLLFLLMLGEAFSLEAAMVTAVIFGSATFLSSLAFVAVIFKNLGLDSKQHALGLPEGSIRAIIAICLIILFVIMAVFLFQRIGPNYMEIEDCQYFNGTAFENITGKAYIPILPTDEQITLANTLVTTVGTLVVALSGFYFGTRAVEVAKGEADRDLVLLTPVDNPYTMGATEKELLIALKPTPEDEPVTWLTPPEGDAEGKLEQYEPNRFRYTPGENAEDTVNLMFKLARYPDKIVKLVVNRAKPEQPNADDGDTE